MFNQNKGGNMKKLTVFITMAVLAVSMSMSKKAPAGKSKDLYSVIRSHFSPAVEGNITQNYLEKEIEKGDGSFFRIGKELDSDNTLIYVVEENEIHFIKSVWVIIINKESRELEKFKAEVFSDQFVTKPTGDTNIRLVPEVKWKLIESTQIDYTNHLNLNSVTGENSKVLAARANKKKFKKLIKENENLKNIDMVFEIERNKKFSYGYVYKNETRMKDLGKEQEQIGEAIKSSVNALMKRIESIQVPKEIAFENLS
jgi:hypothetical protein